MMRKCKKQGKEHKTGRKKNAKERTTKMRKKEKDKKDCKENVIEKYTKK